MSGAGRLKLLETLREFPHAKSVYPFGSELHYADARSDVDPNTIIDELRSFAASRNVGPLDVRTIEPGIEDAFMELMNAPASEAA